MLVTNGKLVLWDRIHETNMVVEYGKIKGFTDSNEYSGDILDCAGGFVFPGCVDIHTHFRDPGATHKEDFESGTKAALAGGVTSIVDMPNNDPPTVDRITLDQKFAIAIAKRYCDYGFFLGVKDIKNLNNIEELLPRIVGIKLYLSKSGELYNNFKDVEEIFRLFGQKTLIAVHCEDEVTIRQNELIFGSHSKIRSEESIRNALIDCLVCAARYNARLHICHVSTEMEVEIIKDFKRQRPNIAHLITCEVTLHHLFLNQDNAEENIYKVNPPLRKRQDNEALLNALYDKTIDCIASDHAPHLLAEKCNRIDLVPAGLPSIQYILPIMLIKHHSMVQIAHWYATNPAKIVNFHKKGELAIGKDADFSIVSPVKLGDTVSIPKDGGFSKCSWSPYSDTKLQYVVDATYIRGSLVFDRVSNKFNMW